MFMPFPKRLQEYVCVSVLRRRELTYLFRHPYVTCRWLLKYHSLQSPGCHTATVICTLSLPVCVLACMYVRTCVMMHMNVCGHLSSGANYLSLCVLRQSLSLACNSPSNLGLMASEPPNSVYYLCLPSIGFTRICHHAWLFACGV